MLRHHANEWTELRAIEWKREGKGQATQSWVNNVEDFIKFSEYWNGKRHVYAGVNPRSTRGGGSAEDVARITLIPFDVDAERPKEYKKDAATVEELREATKKRDLILKWLNEKGLKPYIDFSGNGYRVALLVDLPAHKSSFSKINALHEQVNLIAGGGLDNISDPPRIIKVPGTWSIKGHNDPPRVHRLSKILQIGEQVTDIETLFQGQSEPIPKKIEQSITSDTTKLSTNSALNRLRPCFRRFVLHGTRASTLDDWKHETALRMALVDEAYSVGITDRAEIIQLFKNAEDFTEERTGYEVDRKLREIKQNGGPRLYSEDSIKDHGGCIGPECQLYDSHFKYVPSPGVGISPPNMEREKPTPALGTLFKLKPEDIDKALNEVIKKDDDNKRLLCYGLLLNYTDEDQLNFMPVGPSSTGKSYLTSQVLDFFPDEDKIILGYVSAKAFYHESGYYETIDGKPVDYLEDYIDKALEPWLKDNPKPEKGIKKWEEDRRVQRRKAKNEWLKIPKTKVIDLRQKFLHFLDMPHVELLGHLRPFLSHDAKRITQKITNKLGSGRSATETITLLGYPSVIFNTASFAFDPQEQTRLIQLSPEITPDKLSESISLISEKLRDRDSYKSHLDSGELRKRVTQHILAIKALRIRQVIIPSEVMKNVEEKFRSRIKNPGLKPQHQREYPRLIAYIKASTLFNFAEREKSADGTLTATIEDVEEGFRLYSPVMESNESGMPPAIYEFWIKILEPEIRKSKYLKRSQVAQFYYKKFHVHVGEKALKSLINLLLEAGLIVEDTHPDHGNVKVITTPDVDMEELRDLAREARREARESERESTKPRRRSSFG